MLQLVLATERSTKGHTMSELLTSTQASDFAVIDGALVAADFEAMLGIADEEYAELGYADSVRKARLAWQHASNTYLTDAEFEALGETGRRAAERRYVERRGRLDGFGVAPQSTWADLW